MDLFVRATRAKLRFSSTSTKGMISVEELWDLPLDQLDVMGLSYKTDIESNQGKSLRKNSSSTKANELNQLRLDIIQFIINVKEEEQENRAKQAALKAQKEKIDALLESKQEAKLAELSIEDLIKMRGEIQQQMH